VDVATRRAASRRVLDMGAAYEVKLTRTSAKGKMGFIGIYPLMGVNSSS
jgi:hypothetical protein